MRYLLIFTVYLTFTAGCSKYQSLLKSTDYEKKHEMAMKYYGDEEYYKALPLFEELLTVFRGTLRNEEIYYRFAYCHYHLGDYIMAGYHFRNLAETFPKSKYTEECYFMNAYCYYLNSPEYSLDQTDTEKALNELQLFINKYPESERIKECNELINQLRLKLELKAFHIARLYFKIGDYEAAVVAFKNTLRDFPDGKKGEEMRFLQIKASYLYAVNSIEGKKEERLDDTFTYYVQFARDYPESAFLKEAEKLYNHAKETKRRLETTNKT